MLIRLIRPHSNFGKSLFYLLVGYLVIGLSGCTTPPRTEKPPTSVARAMETRSFSGNLKTVLKASINSLQDMDYTIEVLNSDVGLITASRTTENKKAKLASEGSQEGMTDSEKACLAIGAIAIRIALLVRIQQAEIVFRELKIAFRHDAVAGRRCVAGKRQIFVENLLSRAADFDAGTVAFEGLISNVAVALIAAAAARPSVIGILVHFPCNTFVSGLLGTVPIRTEPLLGPAPTVPEKGKPRLSPFRLFKERLPRHSTETRVTLLREIPGACPVL